MALSATSAEQMRLLDVADLDTKLIQLRHQKASIPELEQVQNLEVELGSIELKIVAAETELSDLTSLQQKAEDDVTQVATRISRDQQKLDGGTASPKELEVLQHEIGTLNNRLAELEEAELELMQQVEDASSALDELTHNRNRVADLLSQTKDVLATKIAELDAQISVEQKSRAELVVGIPKELIDLYEKVKADHGDVGAALIHRGACQGCHIAIDATELTRIKGLPVETVVRCEECRRILVRTAESGL